MDKTLTQWVTWFLKQKQRPSGNIKEEIVRAARLRIRYAGYGWRRAAGGYIERLDAPPPESTYTPPAVYLRQESTGRVALVSTWARELDGTVPRYAPGFRATVLRLLRAAKTGNIVHGSAWDRVSP